jgi:hypothetical protein
LQFYEQYEQEQFEVVTGHQFFAINTCQEDWQDLGCTAPDLVTSQSPSSRIQTYVRKFNPAI